MKKTLLYSLAVLAGVSFASCNGDYDDWASPQSYAQEDAAAAYGVTAALGADGTYKMPEGSAFTKDSVKLITLSSTNENIASYKVRSLKAILETGDTLTMNPIVNGNNICVFNDELDQALYEKMDSRASKTYKLQLLLDYGAVLKNGDAVAMAAGYENKLEASFTTEPTPAIDSKGYFVLGAFKAYNTKDGFVNVNQWDPSTPAMMTDNGDGTYSVIVIPAAEESCGFKIYGDKDGHDNCGAVNANQIGCQVKGDEATNQFAVWNGDRYEVQTPVLKRGMKDGAFTDAGYFEITLNTNTWKYTIKEASAVLWQAGDGNGWNQTDPLASPSFNGVYTGYMYLNSKFKICSQQNWDGAKYGSADFGTEGDNDGNVLLGLAPGFYKVVADMNNKTLSYTAITTIGIIGDATSNGWDASTPMTYDADSHTWVLKDVKLKAGNLKFRANDGWDINWGGNTYESLKQDGANLTINAEGTYDITLWAQADGYAKCTITAK